MKQIPDSVKVTEFTPDHIHALTIGAGVLGSGGGGDPRIAKLRLQNRVELDDCIDIISPESLDPDATVIPVSSVGAPTIIREMLPAGTEEVSAVQALTEAVSGSVDAVVDSEIGGANSVTALLVGALMDLPVVDADGMGRAFPEAGMDTFFINTGTDNRVTLADSFDNEYCYHGFENLDDLEATVRELVSETRSYLACAGPIVTGRQIRKFGISDSISRAIYIGQRILNAADENSTSPVPALTAATGGVTLCTGSVAEVYRRTVNGFTVGTVDIKPDNDSEPLTIEFRNEFLIARRSEKIIASVPDLISIVDATTGQAISTGQVEFGQRIAVIAIPAPDPLRTAQCLEILGPESFGYEHSYQPILDRGH